VVLDAARIQPRAHLVLCVLRAHPQRIDERATVSSRTGLRRQRQKRPVLLSQHEQHIDFGADLRVRKDVRVDFCGIRGGKREPDG